MLGRRPHITYKGTVEGSPRAGRLRRRVLLEVVEHVPDAGLPQSVAPLTKPGGVAILSSLTAR
jgi:hypothetical protein